LLSIKSDLIKYLYSRVDAPFEVRWLSTPVAKLSIFYPVGMIGRGGLIDTAPSSRAAHQLLYADERQRR
jgi:hypothetical protein